MAVKWYDNKLVHLLSTVKEIQPIDHVKRRSVADKSFVEVPRPNIVTHYNEHMGINYWGIPNQFCCDKVLLAIFFQFS